MCMLRIHHFLSSPAILILNSTANSEVIYLFLHRNHHSGISHPISTDSSPPQISPTSIHQPLTPAHLPLPHTMLPPSVYPSSEEVTQARTGTRYSDSELSYASFPRVFYEYCSPSEGTRIYSVITTLFWTPFSGEEGQRSIREQTIKFLALNPDPSFSGTAVLLNSSCPPDFQMRLFALT